MRTPLRACLPRFAATLLLSTLVGCTAPARTESSAPAVSLAVRMVGGGSPTAHQLANIHQAVQGRVVAAGYRFAPHPDAADFVIGVHFTPNTLEPGGGHVAITGVEPRTRTQRGVAGGDDSPEEKEYRARLREIERWTAAEATRH